MNRVPIHLMPDNLLLRITNKMENVCVSRLKRTCSSMDQFVKENHRHLELRRAKIGLTLRIIVDESLLNGSEILATKSGKRTLLETFELTHHGIAISHLSIVNAGGSGQIVEATVDNLRRIRPICDSAEIIGLSAESIVELAGSVECVSQFKINHNRGDVMEFLRILGTAPNCSQFSFKSTSKDYTSDGLFHLLGSFHSFDGCSFIPSSFNRLLWDIYSGNNVSNLQWLFCSLDVNSDEIARSFPFSDLSIPPLKVLWDSSLFSEELTVPRYTPSCIRRMDLRSKTALIVERIHGLCVDEDIFFVDPEPSAVFDVLIRELSITVTEIVRNQYLNGTEEERMNILHSSI